MSQALDGLRPPRARHDPGRVLVDLAVAVADGATTISEIAVLGDQAELFGAVASDSTCWRLLDRLDEAALARVAAARARTRELVWDQKAERHGRAFPPVTVAGQDLDVLVIDLDASIVICHSEKEQAAPTFKRTFGYHPLMAFCDNTSEFLGGVLRRGNAGANTAADTSPCSTRPWLRSPTSTVTAARSWSARTPPAARERSWPHVRDQQDKAVATEFSVGWAITDRERAAIAAVPHKVWADAVDADGSHRDGAGLAELTGLLSAASLAGYPPGTRVIVRRERPHPGAQLDLMETRDGWRYTRFATDTVAGQLAFLDARHRAHARVEDRIRTAKDTGLNHFPSRTFAINSAWLTVVMLAVDLLSWTQHLLLDGHLANAEPKTLRYRLLHVAGRITRGQRRTFARIQQPWPWARQLAAAFAQLRALGHNCPAARPLRLNQPHGRHERHGTPDGNGRPDDPARPTQKPETIMRDGSTTARRE
ncbi:IS1380 family transposase [Pseudonocardia sp. NPDC049154]|uniref:IS1380 family transposase n=1 Tax=Pseudonocardia sp. NPDC049154 TaxID=3155501 RepID=UPI0033E43BDB